MRAEAPESAGGWARASVQGRRRFRGGRGNRFGLLSWGDAGKSSQDDRRPEIAGRVPGDGLTGVGGEAGRVAARELSAERHTRRDDEQDDQQGV